MHANSAFLSGTDPINEIQNVNVLIDQLDIVNFCVTCFNQLTFLRQVKLCWSRGLTINQVWTKQNSEIP